MTQVSSSDGSLRVARSRAFVRAPQGNNAVQGRWWRLLRDAAAAVGGGLAVLLAIGQFATTGDGVAIALFASISGATAVALMLACAALWQQSVEANDKAERLQARLDADMTLEKTFVLRDGQIFPGSPSADAYLRTAPRATRSESPRKRLQSLLGAETFAELAPRLQRLVERRRAFEFDAIDGDGQEIRLRGEMMGARPVLRIIPRLPPVAGAAPPAPPEASVDAAPTDAADPGPEARAFEEVFRHAPIGVVAFDAEHKVIAANERAARLWRLDAERLRAGQTLRGVLNDLRVVGRTPERADFGDWRSAVLRDPVGALSQAPLWSLADGDALQITARSTPGGGFVAFISDRTDALGLERRLSTLKGARQATIAAIDTGLAVVGPDRRLQMINPAFVALWNLDPSLEGAAEDGAGPTFASIAKMAGRSAPEQTLWRRVGDLIAGPIGGRREDSFTYRRDDRVISVRVTPLPDGATMIACSDVSDAHRTESALRERNAALEVADQLLTEFVAAVGVQLRTPLNSIMGFAELLKEDGAQTLTEVQRDYVDSIVAPAKEMRALITNALDVGALQAGSLELKTADVDFRSMVSSLAEMLAGPASASGARIMPRPPDEAVFIRGDEQRLKQAIFAAGCAVLGSAESGDILMLLLVSDRVEAVLRISLVRRGARLGAVQRRNTPAAKAQVSDPAVGGALSFTRRIVELHRGVVEVEEQSGEQWIVAIRLPTSTGQSVTAA